MKFILVIIGTLLFFTACLSSPSEVPATTPSADAVVSPTLEVVEKEAIPSTKEESGRADEAKKREVSPTIASPPAFSPDLKATSPEKVAGIIGNGRPVVLEFFAFW